jgi:hypothetical protein
MSTIGLFGFCYKKNYYMVFNEHCSYFSDGLGESLLYEIKMMCSNNELDLWIKNFLNLKIVTEKDIPSNEDIENLLKHNIDIPSISCCNMVKDWPTILDKFKGSYKKILECGYILIDPEYNKEETIANDSTIEYIYVLDFDNMTYNGYFGDSKAQIIFDLKTNKMMDFDMEPDKTLTEWYHYIDEIEDRYTFPYEPRN